METQNQQIQPPQAPEVSTQILSVNSDSNKSKVIPVILVGLAVVVIAIGVYLLGAKQNQTPVQNIAQTTPIPSPTPVDETANWKSYTNIKRAFTFKYPSNLFVIPGQVDEFIVISDKETTDWSSAEGVKMQVSVLSNPKNLSVQDYFNSFPKVPSTHPRTITYQQTTINGNEAVIATISGCEQWEGCDPDKPSYTKYIKGNAYILQFDTELWEDLWVNMLFSTFKFLEEGTSGLRVCPDSWVEVLSPIPAINNPYYGQKGQFITINDSIDLIPAEKFDLEWIRQNCKVKVPEPVG